MMSEEQQISHEIKKSKVCGLKGEYGESPGMNRLIMKPNHVLENMAKRFGVTRSELLRQNPNIFKQAISDTKKTLTDSGVNVLALENFVSRKGMHKSNHVILVNRLPYDASEEDLAKAFGKFGSIDKVILASSNALALVVFREAAECRTALENLAYCRYKDELLLLEMAPINILSSDANNDTKQELVQEKKHVAEPRSIFVRNLSVKKTSDERLKMHLDANIKEGMVNRVYVFKQNMLGKKVSLGWGFIECDSSETAKNVCRDLKGTVLDGCNLQLFPCHVNWEKDIPQD